MTTRRLLYLTAQQMLAYRWQGGVPAQDDLFANNDVGQQRFAAYLAAHPNDVFVMVADLADEGFQVETIPYLRGADRQTVIARKLGQSFFGAPLTAAQSLGHARGARKDERVLLTALTNREFLQPWLSTMARAQTMLAGIYSLPLLVSPLLARLKIAEPQCLLLSYQNQSIRQSYLENGKVLFSRLTPLHSINNEVIAQAFAVETQRLQQYLAGQRRLSQNQPVRAYILAHPSMLAAVRAQCLSHAAVEFIILDLAAVARQTGLKALPADMHSEALFLHLAAAAPPGIQFADDDLRHAYRLRQLRAALYGVGAAVLAACLLVSAVLLYRTYTVRQESIALQNAALQTLQRYEGIVKTFPPAPTDSETLRRVINRYLELDRQRGTPTGLYREISRALHALPAIEIDAIDWQTAAAGQTAKTSGAPVPANALPPGAVPPGSESAIVRGTVRLGAQAGARRALELVDRFVGLLQANPALRIDILKRPFDIEPGKTLKHEDTLIDDNKPRSFTVQITRKIGS